jgi:D-arabinose 1-dehydrogenase-like Zn-dependent alcohol dehydrogenase
MKHEITFDNYINEFNKENLHPELKCAFDNLPNKFCDFGNLIFFGPPNVGKYTQALKFIEKYSNCNLKYNKKIKFQNEKSSYIYKVSDIHYEIDMNLLGCNSKQLWHEIFLQIIDIISAKNEKKGIILCKNFHLIHSELLEIFYSYIQQYSKKQLHVNYEMYNNNMENKNEALKNVLSNQSGILLSFVIITEQISFFPNNIIERCKIISIGKPKKEMNNSLIDYFIYKNFVVSESELTKENTNKFSQITKEEELKKTTTKQVEKKVRKNTKKNEVIVKNKISDTKNEEEVNFFIQYSNSEKSIENVIDYLNSKSNLNSVSLNCNETENKNIETISNNIISIIKSKETINYMKLRNVLYDILIYNLDVSECIWYILSNLDEKKIKSEIVRKEIIKKIFVFFKYYNNNYRPIYHLECIIFYIINIINE